MPPSTKEALINHLEFVNNLLNSMVPSSPVPSLQHNILPYELIDRKNPKQLNIKNDNRQEWELQFYEKLNMNPPCYLKPPQSVMGIYNFNKKI